MTQICVPIPRRAQLISSFGGRKKLIIDHNRKHTNEETSQGKSCLVANPGSNSPPNPPNSNMLFVLVYSVWICIANMLSLAVPSLVKILNIYAKY